MTKYKEGDKVFYTYCIKCFCITTPCIGYGTVVGYNKTDNIYTIEDADMDTSISVPAFALCADSNKATAFAKDWYEKAKAELEEVYRMSKECIERNS